MENRRYTELNCRFPICNHTKNISSDNLGYMQGILEDGTPFEAELWKNEAGLNVSFVLPDNSPDRKELPKMSDGNISYFRNEVKLIVNGVLTDGMVFDGECQDTKKVAMYVDRLVDYGLVSFVGNMENGIVLYFTDIEGKELVYITITLEEETILATTPLLFGKFYDYDTKVIRNMISKSKWKVYSSGTSEERKKCIEMINECVDTYGRYGLSFPEGFPDEMTTEDMLEWISVWSDFNPYPDVN